MLALVSGLKGGERLHAPKPPLEWLADRQDFRRAVQSYLQPTEVIAPNGLDRADAHDDAAVNFSRLLRGIHGCIDENDVVVATQAVEERAEIGKRHSRPQLYSALAARPR